MPRQITREIHVPRSATGYGGRVLIGGYETDIEVTRDGDGIRIVESYEYSDKPWPKSEAAQIKRIAKVMVEAAPKK